MREILICQICIIVAVFHNIIIYIDFENNYIIKYKIYNNKSCINKKF